MYKGLQEVRDARVIYLDMNSFFASAEQQRDPGLRDKPVAVVSHIAPKGTVLAASYEAKACGIRTGTKYRDALALCPTLIIREPDPPLYRGIHHQFMGILRDMCGLEVAARSIDEAAIYLAPNWYGSEKALALSLSIKDRFREELGSYIRCSVGIAPNSLLAKVASNLKKPDGLSEITLDDLEPLLKRLALTDLPGIAERGAANLMTRGIYTPYDLYASDPVFLQKQFGIWGRYWWWRLHGYETEGLSSGHKSMSHQHVLTKWIYDLEEVKPVVAKMTDRLIHRLRRNSFQCSTVWIYLSQVEAKGLSAERHFDSPLSSYPALSGAIFEMLAELPHPLTGPIRKVVLGFNNLSTTDCGLQLDLFDARPGQERISQAIEDIRLRFGSDSIAPATLFLVGRKVAQEQLGFGLIKDRFTSD